jgi:hypothetical protein
MRSQINLFDDFEAAPEAKAFSGTAIISAAAALIIGCVGIGVVSNSRLHEAETNAKSVSALRSKLSAEHTALGTSNTKSEADPTIERLTAEREALRQATRTTKAADQGNRPGFSKVLTALTSHTQPGLVVTMYEINGDNGALRLVGRSSGPAGLPSLIIALQADDALKNRSFSRMEMGSATEANDAPYVFELSSTGDK